MDRVDLFSVVCGFLAMSGVALAMMALGYEGMSFEQPWPQLASGAILIEVLLMRWMGPLPGMVVVALFPPFDKRWAQAETLVIRLFFLCIPVTAVGLAFFLLNLMRRTVE